MRPSRYISLVVNTIPGDLVSQLRSYWRTAHREHQSSIKCSPQKSQYFFPFSVIGKICGTTGTTVCFARMWMLPALNPRRKAVDNNNCSTTCKENCAIRDGQNGVTRHQNECRINFAFYMLVKWSVLNPSRFDGNWGDIESKVRSLYPLTWDLEHFALSTIIPWPPNVFFFFFFVVYRLSFFSKSFTKPYRMIHISSLIPALKNLSLYFKR